MELELRGWIAHSQVLAMPVAHRSCAAVLELVVAEAARQVSALTVRKVRRRDTLILRRWVVTNGERRAFAVPGFTWRHALVFAGGTHRKAGAEPVANIGRRHGFVLGDREVANRQVIAPAIRGRCG